MSYSLRLTQPESCVNNLNLWSQPEFMQAVMSLHKCEGYHLQCYKGNQLIALLPVYERKLLSYRTLISPSSSYYQALNLWIEDSSRPARKLLEALQAMRQIACYLHEHYKRIHFNLSPDSYDVRGFTWEHLKAVPLYTFTHDFSDTLQILPDEKNRLNKAQQQGYYLGEELRISEFTNLVKAMNGRKKHEMGIDYRSLASYFEQLYHLGILRQFNLYSGDKVVSSNILLTGKDKRAFTVLRATEDAALKNGASSIHTMLLIERLRDELIELDFCGANVPEVARFKTALGLKLKVFFQIRS